MVYCGMNSLQSFENIWVKYILSHFIKESVLKVL